MAPHAVPNNSLGMQAGQLDQPSHPCEVSAVRVKAPVHLPGPPQAQQPWRDDAGTATRVKSGDALIAELSSRQHSSNVFPHPPALSDQVFSFPGLLLPLPTSLPSSQISSSSCATVTQFKDHSAPASAVTGDQLPASKVPTRPPACLGATSRVSSSTDSAPTYLQGLHLFLRDAVLFHVLPTTRLSSHCCCVEQLEMKVKHAGPKHLNNLRQGSDCLCSGLGLTRYGVNSKPESPHCHRGHCPTCPDIILGCHSSSPCC